MGGVSKKTGTSSLQPLPTAIAGAVKAAQTVAARKGTTPNMHPGPLPKLIAAHLKE